MLIGSTCAAGILCSDWLPGYMSTFNPFNRQMHEVTPVARLENEDYLITLSSFKTWSSALKEKFNPVGSRVESCPVCCGICRTKPKKKRRKNTTLNADSLKRQDKKIKKIGLKRNDATFNGILERNSCWISFMGWRQIRSHIHLHTCYHLPYFLLQSHGRPHPARHLLLICSSAPKMLHRLVLADTRFALFSFLDLSRCHPTLKLTAKRGTAPSFSPRPHSDGKSGEVS